MKKGQILLITILLTGGGIFTSCENFLNGEKIKEEIEEQIALANAPAFPILIDGSKGKFSPSKGSYPIKVTQGMNIAFESDTDFEFIRWEVFNVMTGESLDSDGYIEFTDSKSDETSFKLLKEPGSEMQLGVRSIVSARPQIVSYTPNSLGMLKDSTVQILFNRDIDPDSIYYSEKERKELKVSERLSDSDFLHTTLGDEIKYYGYTKGGKTFFKNIILSNNKTGDNINDRFESPVFESPRVLSIFASKKSGHILDDFTQVLVEVEKGFFYTEQEKNVEMAGSKMWMYQVNSKTDVDPLVISSFAAKLSDSTSLQNEENHTLGDDGAGLDTLKFIKDGKLQINVTVQEENGGAGPNSFFTLNVKKLFKENYVPLDTESQTSQSTCIDFQDTTSDEGEYNGVIDFNNLPDVNLDDGVYEMNFEFKDRCGNPTTYPSDGKKYYFAVDTKAPEISTPTITSDNSTTYRLEWTENCFDLNTIEIIHGESGSTMTTESIEKGTKFGDITDILPNKSYEVKVRFTDYAGNYDEKTIPNFLTGFELTGTPTFTGGNASHAENIFLVGDKISDYGITTKKYYSDGSSMDVSSSTFVPTRNAYNSSWIPSCSEGSISKSTSITSGTYYVAKKDALTQKIVKLENNIFKFGDFPQTESTISSYTSSALYNGWYLGSDGYFYEQAEDSKYYKVEPVCWNCLNENYDGKKLLVSNKILLDGIEFYGSRENSYLDGNLIPPNNYPYSNIRAYLNGIDNQYVLSGGSRRTYDKDWAGKGFLQKAFTSNAQNLIATMIVGNAEIPGNYDTKDKIFLLNLSEASIGIVRYRTDYAKKNGNTVKYIWTRSPYYSKRYGYGTVPYIEENGYYGGNTAWVDGDIVGVVPALCVSPSDLP